MKATTKKIIKTLTPAQVQKKWIKALRSEKYEQGRYVLRSSNGFCCLGVLCDLAVKAKVIPKPTVDDYYGYIYGKTGDSNGSLLPRAVKRWAGLNSQNGSYEEDGVPCSLDELNDYGMPFAKIASIIESKPQDLFVK